MRYDTKNARVQDYRDYRKYCNEKKKMNKHENSNILQNDFEKLVKTWILLHFQVLLILFMLSFLLSSLLRDEVKSKSRYNLS